MTEPFYIAEIRAALGRGETRIVCPGCNGGSSSERSLALYVGSAGRVNYHCHRAGCGLGGTLDGYHGPQIRPVDERPDSRAWKKPVFADEPHLSAHIRERFGVVGPMSFDWVGAPLLHILSPRGARRGYVHRRIFWGDKGEGPKTVTYMEDQNDVQLSWHAPPEDTSGCVVLVEDIVSAWKCAAAGYDTAALLGTGLNQEKVAEIAREGGRELPVLIALDKDAAGQAFAHAKKWGLAFESTRVVLLERDLKDMDVQDIPEVLG